jgi:hypothetical protein
MIKKAIYTGNLAKLHGVRSPATIFGDVHNVAEFEVLRERKWFSFVWNPPSNLSLLAEVAASGGQSCYPFLLRESNDRFILLSTHHSIVQAFFRACRIESLIEYPRVNVVQLVSAVTTPMQAEGRSYRLGAVFAAAEGYGRSLKTVAFWGDDLGDAGLFREMSSKLAPFRAAVRDVRTDREIASVGSGGEVSLFYRGLSHLDQTDRLFRFFTDLDLISWGLSHE